MSFDLRRRRNFVELMAATATVVALIGSPIAEAQDAEQQPSDSGLTVRANVSLVFIDAEVVDREGNPIPGLTKDDFSVRLDTRSYPIYSVDDLCGCADESGRESIGSSSSSYRARTSFVLFFDFSHLRGDGRTRSLQEAERWLREVKRPEDRVLIVASSSRAGLRQLCPLTEDLDELLDALGAVREDPELEDEFPLKFFERLEHCRSGTLSCRNVAMQEYRVASDSMSALMHFLTRLQLVPGRKTLLYFHQDSAVFPARLYSGDSSGRTFLDGTPTDSVSGIQSLIDEVAGTAVSTGTVIFPITAGISSWWTTDFNASLARFTGGRAAGQDDDLRALMDSAGRGCACMYRIGLELPEPDRSQVYRVRIGVGEELGLEHDYRVQLLSGSERWRRNASAVLLDPESVRGLRTAAAVIPVSASRGRWRVKVQVVLDAGSLSLLPEGTDHVAEWEVGALLARRGGRRHLEMLGASRIRCGTDECGLVVHEREIDRLRPGEYELRTFVHDRWSDAFGGAKATIVLPAPRDTSVVGPLLGLRDGRYFSTALPLRTKKANPFRSQERRMSTGFVPLTQPVVSPGTPIGARAFICDRRSEAGAPVTRRRVLLEGRPLAELDVLDEPEEGEGGCWSITDPLETWRASPGRYEYELHWTGSRDPSLATVATRFEIAPARQFVKADHGESQREGGREQEEPSAADDESELDSTDVVLPELLDRLAAVASRYRDNALRFTCEETIVSRSRGGKNRTLAFEYIYAHDAAGNLRDYRVYSRRGRDPDRGTTTPMIVNMAAVGLQIYVLRAYSSVFIFERDHQHLYDFELVGEEEVLGRRAVKVRLEAIPPHVEGVNDWIGAAWVDRQTYELLRFEGLKVDDHRQKRIFSLGIEQSVVPRPYDSRSFDGIEVEFGEQKNGMRFPSKVVIRRTVFATARTATYLRSPGYRVLEVEQSYDDYRLFGVTTEETVGSVPID